MFSRLTKLQGSHRLLNVKLEGTSNSLLFPMFLIMITVTTTRTLTSTDKNDYS